MSQYDEIVNGYTLIEMMDYAETVREQHDPAKQGHGYQRCSLCNYTHHPCDTYELAALVIALLDERETHSDECGLHPSPDARSTSTDDGVERSVDDASGS